MLKKILLSSMLSIVATGAFAVSSTVTSKDYVDDLVATKQAKIPAAGVAGVGIGDTVVTYTPGGNGVIGERGIYSDASSYNATTDADKIITASALRAAVSNISTTTTSKLTCHDANCTLWNISDQTAYTSPGIDLVSLIGDSETVNTCFVLYDGGMYWCGDYLEYGMSASDPNSFVVDYGEAGLLRGHGRCSSREGTDTFWEDDPANFVDNLTDETYRNGAPYCYCGLDSYTPLNGDAQSLSGPWVFYKDYIDWDNCAAECVSDCMYSMTGQDDFQIAVFNAYH